MLLLDVQSTMQEELFLDLSLGETIELGLLIAIYWIILENLKNNVARRLVLASGVAILLSWVLPYIGLYNFGMYSLVLALAIIITTFVVFFEDLRKWLVGLSAQNIVSSPNKLKGFAGKMPDHGVRELLEAIEEMKKKQLGALIVIPGKDDASIYMQDEIDINAIVSKELLLSIFNTKGPLHDGAVVIEKDRVRSARNILPVTREADKTDYGTRHRAAIGLTEVCDAMVIVVSEERGAVSICHSGAIRTLDNSNWEEELRGWLV